MNTFIFLHFILINKKYILVNTTSFALIDIYFALIKLVEIKLN
jgi:hypothetical protein